MRRILTHARTVALACSALALALPGCGPQDDSSGGIEATLTLDTDALDKHFTDLGVLIQCNGIDPVTGVTWKTRVFTVDVSTSEGNDPLDPANKLGIFKMEGIPEGDCTITVGTRSDDETMTCLGQMMGIPVVPGPDNTFVTILLNCISDGRSGGIGGDATFNQCMEYSQITVTPTAVEVGSDMQVDVWCYDPDGDDGQALVLFVTAASLAANPGDAGMWESCGTVSNGSVSPCAHQEPPTDPLSPSTSQTVTCEVANEACVVFVSVSDDFFAHIYRDPYGCAGGNDNAFAQIPVYCQDAAFCGDGAVNPGEECDPPGAPNASNEYCDSSCELFDPCESPEAAPANCPAPIDPLCQAAACTAEGDGNIACRLSNAPNGTFCGTGLTCQDGVCFNCGAGGCAECGDGVLGAGEQCDDGNTVGGDGCDETCFWEPEQSTLDVCCAAAGGFFDVPVTYDYVPLTTVQQGQVSQIELDGNVDLSSIGVAIDLAVINPSDVSIAASVGSASLDTFPIPTPQSVNPATQPLVSTGVYIMDVVVDPAASQICLDIASVLVNVNIGLTVACTPGTCGGTPNAPICFPASP